MTDLWQRFWSQPVRSPGGFVSMLVLAALFLGGCWLFTGWSVRRRYRR